MDLADLDLFHCVAWNDYGEAGLVSKEEPEQLLADRHLPAGHDPTVHGFFGDPDVKCVFHGFSSRFPGRRVDL